MEELRRAGLVHFQNATSEAKDRIIAMFKGLDADEDGKISKNELIGLLAKQMPKSKISHLFTELDKDGNGFLDFYEFRTFYYACISRPICDCCKEIVGGLYYCCVRCWEGYIGSSTSTSTSSGGDDSQPFDLCTRCYTGRLYRHRHTEFLDNNVMFRSKELSGAKMEKPKANKTEEVMKAGRLYYRALSTCEQGIAEKLFREMDGDGDGRVSRDEVVDFLIRKGLTGVEASKVFADMNIVGNYLKIEDVVALWYTFVMRPCCDRCTELITGSYYSCVTCFHTFINGDTDSYDLCLECYISGDLRHKHKVFLDNHVLLQMQNPLENYMPESSHMQALESSNNGEQDAVARRRLPVRRMMLRVGQKAAGAAMGVGMGAALTMVCSIM